MPFKIYAGPTVPPWTASWRLASEQGEKKPDDPIVPQHYEFPGGIKVIDLTQYLNFCRGNVVKYVCRAGKKDAARELEDLRKAAWYLEREIARLERERRASAD
jgi:hypothetical protein